MLHITALEWEDAYPVRPLVQFREAIKLSLASEGYAAQFYDSGAMAGGILELPASMSKKGRDAVEEGFQRKYEGRENWFRTVILREGARFHATTQSAQDSQTAQLREDQVREIARFYNLPPSKVGLPDTVSYNSLEQENWAYLESTLAPYLETTEQQCWLKLLGPESQRTHYFEANTNKLLRADIKTRYEIYDIGIRIGVLSPNECRQFENLNDRPGGDTYVDPQRQPGSPDESEEPEPESEAMAGDDDEARGRFNALSNLKANGKLPART